MHKKPTSNRGTAMKRLLTVAVIFAGSALISAHGAAADDAEMIKSAEAAAPPAVSKDATIYTWGEGGAMNKLREGTNGYWCMPDEPRPGDSSMCGDANAMEWLMAIAGKKEPPKGKIGLVYMLAGVDMQASNLDPYAPAPANESDYVKTGPHIMILNAMDQLHGYPGGANPDTTKPYVMFPDTPYAHIMYPVE
jgi:hypothetical protein